MLQLLLALDLGLPNPQLPLPVLRRLDSLHRLHVAQLLCLGHRMCAVMMGNMALAAWLLPKEHKRNELRCSGSCRGCLRSSRGLRRVSSDKRASLSALEAGDKLDQPTTVNTEEEWGAMRAAEG
eukprot:2709131-Rhodomonas_salina.2